ncbi:hypothetical protein Adeg_1364 [Ammonifex degensii KC4]|uniref:Ribbon-helix-helix protein CopG domain-containing protein n=1 Tax=Ammonifex degensii (strain DSM 10501 / KC4) TaxID=429009 RepID=C9R837_AMMDK|nr:hypothetical protein [Ammonifex degensii]ACX52466.1 hypothetical protein Adeg_1364 [Ammonifex degensii KC4]
MRKKEGTERVNVRLPVEVAKWVREKAYERGTTISTVVAECVEAAHRHERDREYSLACLRLCAALLSFTGRDPQQVRREVAEQWAEWALRRKE